MRRKLIVLGFLVAILVTVAGNAQNPVSVSPVSIQSSKVLAKLENENLRISFVSCKRKNKKSVAPVFEVKTASGWLQTPVDASAESYQILTADTSLEMGLYGLMHPKWKAAEGVQEKDKDGNTKVIWNAGNFGDGKITSPQLNWTHRNNQRIGVAIADNPNGPWKRFDQPIIDISSDTTAHDEQMVVNPSVTQMPDGRFLMVYKAVASKKPQPFGGPVVHLTAISENPEGPFVKQNKPIFTAENVDFPAEDPYVWYQDNCYYAIVKDMKGAFTDAGRSLVLFYSLDGLDWKLAKHPLVSTLNIKWEDGNTQKLEALERPQLFFENGKMVALLCAVTETQGHSYNVQIPLKSK